MHRACWVKEPRHRALHRPFWTLSMCQMTHGHLYFWSHCILRCISWHVHVWFCTALKIPEHDTSDSSLLDQSMEDLIFFGGSECC